jgi:hypothetical protein
MSFIPPIRPPLNEQLARSKEQEIERKASDYARTHPDGPVPNPSTHRMVRRLWRVLQGRHHGRGDSSGLG